MTANRAVFSFFGNGKLLCTHLHGGIGLVIFAFLSPGVLAETIKTESKDIKRFECGNETLVSLAQSPEYPVLNGDRLLSFGKGHRYTFYIGEYTQSEADRLEIIIEETRRKTHIEDDLAQVFEYLKLKIKTRTIAPEPVKTCIAYTSAFERSTITIQINSKPPINRSLIAGPEEHWALSADLPVQYPRQLTYDSTTSTIVEKDKPTSFYISANYKLGDVYTNYGSLDWQNFSGKLLFKASSAPNESMGIGIGYSFKLADLFIARAWTRDDASSGQPRLGTTKSTIFGISFNISKGIAWLKAD